MKKKLLSLLLIAAMAFSAFALTSCSGDSGESGNASAEETGAVEKATEGEITVYTALEDEQVSTYLEAFNEEYPDITVNVVR